MSLSSRIGTFFILLGIGLIALFVLSDVAQSPTCNFLIAGGVSLIMGLILWFRSPHAPAPKAERFRMLRKRSEKKAKK